MESPLAIRLERTDHHVSRKKRRNFRKYLFGKYVSIIVRPAFVDQYVQITRSGTLDHLVPFPRSFEPAFFCYPVNEQL